MKNYENPTKITREKIEEISWVAIQVGYPTAITFPTYWSCVGSYYVFRPLWYPVKLCPKENVNSPTLFLVNLILYACLLISWPFLLLSDYYSPGFLEISIRKTWIFGIHTAISINNKFATEQHTYTLLDESDSESDNITEV